VCVPCGIHETKLFLNTSHWGATNAIDSDTRTKSYDQPNWQNKGNTWHGSPNICRQQHISTCFFTVKQDRNTRTQRQLKILANFRDSKYLRMTAINHICTLPEIENRSHSSNGSYHTIQLILVSPSYLLYRFKIKNLLQLEPCNKMWQYTLFFFFRSNSFLQLREKNTCWSNWNKRCYKVLRTTCGIQTRHALSP
jgi:hypothetical protein